MAMEHSALIVDYIIFIIFILGSTFAPLWSKKVSGPTTKADYVFATGSGVSMAAMMMSIARGTLGVRSFLGFPSELYYRGSAMWETLYGMICAYPIVTFIFVPVYYSLGITSVYQYLDLRFKSRTVRCLASATYVWRQLLNLGVTVFTPCVALNTVIGIPYWASILGITVISIIFTLLGGLKAAIKADVIQGVTMILISMAIIIQGCVEAGGVGPVFNSTISKGRLNFFDFKWDLTVRADTMSAWVGQMFMSVSLFGCQQNFVQRYCSMSSESKVRKTLMYNIPVITVLFSLSWIVGMVIFATYELCDPLTAGYTKKMDEILPFFVEDKFNYMPGLMGLFMGSLFNGALSISVSNLNSLATVTWEDFLSQAPAFKGLKDRQQLKIIKALGAMYGIIIMGISFGVGLLSGVIESSMLVTSATSGPLLGVFILAMLVPCANRKGAIVGMVVSHVFTTWVAIGHIMYGMKKVEMLPLSTDGCSNASFSSHIAKPMQQWPLPAPPLEVNNNNYFNQATAATPPNLLDTQIPLLPLYAISYMYYALVGTCVTVFVGILVSLVAGTDESDRYDEHLLHPLALRISRMCPGTPRRYANAEPIVGDLAVTRQTSKAGETDNYGFDLQDSTMDKKVFDEIELSKKNATRILQEPMADGTFKRRQIKENGIVQNGEYSTTASRHFENYDRNTRNDFRGDRKGFNKENVCNNDLSETVDCESNQRFRKLTDDDVHKSQVTRF